MAYGLKACSCHPLSACTSHIWIFYFGYVDNTKTFNHVDTTFYVYRFAREWKKSLGIENVFFYHGTGESMPSIESESFDLIQYTYVVHEMPFENAKRFLQECMRLLKPGGVLSGFEGKCNLLK